MRPSATLKANADRVFGVISQFNVRNPRVFGSVARGEDNDDSDLDILVDPGEDLTLFDLARVERELSAILGCRVEVTTPGGLADDVAQNVAREMKPL